MNKRHVPIDQAKGWGHGLVRKKYGEDMCGDYFLIRPFSRTLWRHVQNTATGTIGLFKIILKARVAAGVRRIEAATAARWSL